MSQYKLQPAEKETLKNLAREYMTCALSDQQKKVQQLWADFNNGTMQRPMIMIDQIPWHEMDVDGSLVCTILHPYWRTVEQDLRRKIYQYRHMPADMVLPPYLCLPPILKDPDFRYMGIPVSETVVQTDAKNDIMSYQFHNQFETMADVEKIKQTYVAHDTEAEQAVLEEAAAVFSGIAPYYFEGIHLNMGLWDIVSMWMSIEECYYALVDDPELLHAIMERCTQVALRWVQEADAGKLFDTASGICHCSCTLNKPFEDVPPVGSAKNGWVCAQAQLFSSVAPSVTREFEVAYMSRIFAEVGNVYYGCCERLDDRLETICTMPNLRKVSCSPWSDPDVFAEKLPKHIIMSNKPNPALVCAACSEPEEFRKHLRKVIAAAKRNGTRLEMILKDLSSVQYNPQRLWEAHKIMAEEVQNW